MDSRHEGNAAQQKFTFVDQTDRSREAFKAHKAVVRSHCMTEVRRQRRVKVTVEKESPSNVTTFMSEWDGKDSWQETHHLLPEGFDWASWNDYHSTKNTQAGIEDDLLTQLVNDDGDHARNETYGVQYASQLKAYSATRAEEEEQSNQNRRRSPSPTILGTSRVDPFRPLPITADRDVYRLVDHCKYIRSKLPTPPLTVHRHRNYPLPNVRHSQQKSRAASTLQRRNTRRGRLPLHARLLSAPT